MLSSPRDDGVPDYNSSVAELSQLAPGTMLGDRYRIDELISIGGMGAVYSASHMFLNKRLAIKVLRNDLPGAEMMADRFRREAIAASAIGHENIVRVTDMGMSPHNDPYLVMELLHGRDLADAVGTHLSNKHANTFHEVFVHGSGQAQAVVE